MSALYSVYYCQLLSLPWGERVSSGLVNSSRNHRCMLLHIAYGRVSGFVILLCSNHCQPVECLLPAGGCWQGICQQWNCVRCENVFEVQEWYRPPLSLCQVCWDWCFACRNATEKFNVFFCLLLHLWWRL